MIEKLLTPRTLAVVGASRTPGKIGHEVIANLKEGGFLGRIIPVNPIADEILGLPCCRDLGVCQNVVDLSVISVPAQFVGGAVEGSIKVGARAVVVISSGFKETGPVGAALELEIAEVCSASAVRLLGPNCLGLINTQHHMNASFASQMPMPGGISVISQSGALCTVILDWAVERHVGLAKVVSIGNKADIDETDLLAALADDPDTQVIVVHLESIAACSKFMRVIEAASCRKPIVCLKSASTETGQRSASLHTGRLCGPDPAYRSVFRRAGVVEVDDIESLFDVATALATQPLPKGDRVAIISNGGGPGALAADAVERSGMKVVPLSNAWSCALRQKGPLSNACGGTISVLGDSDPAQYVRALDAGQNDDSVDSLILVLAPQVMTQPEETIRAIAGSFRGKSTKPVLTSCICGRNAAPASQEQEAEDLPIFSSPERAAAALRGMWAYAAWRSRPPQTARRFPARDRHVERIIAAHRRRNGIWVAELEAKDILRAYGFDVPEGRRATTAEEILEAAEQIGYPVAMKIISPDANRKSDVGGVRLNLSDPDAVLDAYDVVMSRVRRKLPWARIDGVYVETMGTPGREVRIILTRDPHLGPVLTLGTGPKTPEGIECTGPILAPTTDEEALEMLTGTQPVALFGNAREPSKVDLAALALDMQRLTQLATEFPQISELWIDPLIVHERGNGTFVADARMTLSDVTRNRIADEARLN